MPGQPVETVVAEMGEGNPAGFGHTAGDALPGQGGKAGHGGFPGIRQCMTHQFGKVDGEPFR
jgi:hypothetical protein